MSIEDKPAPPDEVEYRLTVPMLISLMGRVCLQAGGRMEFNVDDLERVDGQLNLFISKEPGKIAVVYTPAHQLSSEH